MSIDQEKMIVEALPSLYPLKDYEEDAIHAVIDALPPSQPEPLQPWEVLAAQAVLSQPAEPKRGKWILDRSGAYCCSECMEPCASYVMMKPRDKFCKMCGAKMEVTT